MSNHNRFRWCNRHIRAIIHAIGQMQMNREIITTNDIAELMSVSKPTAKKYLNKMVESGHVEKTTVPYRANIEKATWKLSPVSLDMFVVGAYKSAYIMYCQIVLGVTIHE